MFVYCNCCMVLTDGCDRFIVRVAVAFRVNVFSHFIDGSLEKVIHSLRPPRNRFLYPYYTC